MAHVAKKGRVVTSREFSKGSGTDHYEDREFDVGIFKTATATVEIPISVTTNLGNYESVRTGVTITLPCYVEDIDECFAKAKKFAEGKAEEMLEFSRAFNEFMKRWRRGDYA